MLFLLFPVAGFLKVAGAIVRTERATVVEIVVATTNTGVVTTAALLQNSTKCAKNGSDEHTTTITNPPVTNIMDTSTRTDTTTAISLPTAILPIARILRESLEVLSGEPSAITPGTLLTRGSAANGHPLPTANMASQTDVDSRLDLVKYWA